VGPTLLEQARRSELIVPDISALAARIREECEDVPALIRSVLPAGPEAAAALAFAAHAAGRPCDAAVAIPILPALPEAWLVPVLVGACSGDRLGALLDLSQAERLHPEYEVTALFVAATLLEGGDPPPRLVIWARLAAHRIRHPELGLLVGLAAREIDDEGVAEVAGHWMSLADSYEGQRTASELRDLLLGPPLRVLPHEAARRVLPGATVRRALPKVGRNDPCPCGSGKKYKKCCAAAEAPSGSPVPGLTWTEYLVKAGPHLTLDQLDDLRPHDLARLPFADLPTRLLCKAFRILVLYRRWADAERLLEVLDRRTDLPHRALPGDWRVDLCEEAIRCGAFDVAERQLARLGDPSRLSAVARLRLELERAAPVPLSRIAEEARRALEDEGALVDLAYALLDAVPPLGILVARAALSAERPMDSMMLVEHVEEARDRLLLPPGDRAGEICSALLAEAEIVEDWAPDEEDENAAEARALRRELARVSARTQDLERQLREREEEVRIAREQAAASAADAPREPAAPPADPDRVRLRQRIEELQAMIRERNEERAELRRKIVQLEAAHRVPEDPGAPEGRAPSTEALESDEARRPLRVPAFAANAREALTRVPPHVARAALREAAALAAGDPRAWRASKLLEGIEGLWSARIGIHHRLLFRARDEALDLLDLIHRQELETVLKRYR
jgi:hypothetical protein